MEFNISTKGKGVFLTLSTLTLILIMGIATLLWYFVSPRFHEVSHELAFVVLSSIRIFFFFILLGIIFLWMTCYLEKVFRPSLKFIRMAITFLFPFTVYVGKVFGIHRDRIRESFVQVNNAFIKNVRNKIKPERILVLLPHCLQNIDCPYRVTNHIENCRECGKCTIMYMKRIKEKYNVSVAIATGGTLARRIIVTTKPKFIIAIACQRDLVDGLIEVFPIPVYGLLNERPQGPCINTTVDYHKIESVIDIIIEK